MKAVHAKADPVNPVETGCLTSRRENANRRTPMNRIIVISVLGIFASGTLAAQEVSSVMGWQTASPEPGTHRLCIDLAAPHGGKGSGKILGSTDEKGARGCFIQEFFGKTAIPAGKTYRYSVWYRTDDATTGRGQLLIDSYTEEGEKSHKGLVVEKLGPSATWREIKGEVTVPVDAVRVRVLLYLHGRGTIWYDDAFFGDVAADATNLLRHGGFEPAATAFYDLAPEKKSGDLKFSSEFENGTLGRVKQLGPNEYYLQAFAEDKPRSPFLWFHFRLDGCERREITFHMNPAPFSAEKTGGNGTRTPVMSYDGDNWVGIGDKSWSEDGSLLTFKQRFGRSPVWIASFFPYTADHITRFIKQNEGNPCFKVSVLGKTKEGRDMRMYTITDPSVPEDKKRAMMFTTLQHDLETTGAMAIEGMCRFLLSNDERARDLLGEFVVYVVPMMNPDGIANGNMYCPVGNLNRQWGLGTTAETAAVEKFVRGLAAGGKKIDLFMDFHGWCTPERSTVFMTFGKEIADAESETESLRLIEAIRPRLSGKVHTTIWRKRVTTVTSITGDLNRLSAGWIKFEAGGRLAFAIEIFGEGTCDQQGYFDWGRAFAEGIADFYRATVSP